MPAFLLNHQVHFDAIVSQFRLNTDITADFCYLTKSTASWWLVLVEIERPDIPLFRADKKRLIQTAEFTARLAQIQEWKDAVSGEGQHITAQLDPIRKPLARNAVHFKYILVVGRDPVGREEEASRRIDQINGTDLRVVTFDSTRALRETARAAEETHLAGPVVDAGKPVQQTSNFCTPPVRSLTAAPLSRRSGWRCATTRSFLHTRATNACFRHG
jgi:hypothetical protein